VQRCAIFPTANVRRTVLALFDVVGERGAVAAASDLATPSLRAGEALAAGDRITGCKQQQRLMLSCIMPCNLITELLRRMIGWLQACVC
jgi:hypothetical protein